MYTTSTDSDLWQAYLAGNEAALGTIAERYYATLKHYGQKFSVSEFVVKDCIQDLFLQLWQNRTQINDTLSVKHYLLKGLRNHIFMHIRSSKRMITHDLDWELGTPENISGESILIENEAFSSRVQQLQLLMNQLSSREREAIYLHYYQNMSIGEIAEVMQVNRQSVSNFLTRAMSKMRNHCQPQHFFIFLYLFLKF
ncbi:RNA polymerase subunit sigma-24 [Siphonobacter sp. BAB-5385]|uniref:RNA polymerase sigma factor n=1 Tax=Siphonobacter sp. BAB-5385 TaxID=1864822 RepID=UPI000B9E5451|nr:sigma-70 family RNA polymerase sigma factor [Siphonobacter sp. BAB-5385]OZI06845.1 RNA polymerase subunit sigma-24 [Siphonobacter sp. BAB-5385]